jgi:hypothetical protein
LSKINMLQRKKLTEANYMEPTRRRSNKKEFNEKNGIFNLIFKDINTHTHTHTNV